MVRKSTSDGRNEKVPATALNLTKELVDDLGECIKTLDVEIEYLEQAIPTYPKESWVRVRFVARYNKLLNGRNYIAGLVADQRTKEKK